MFCDLLEIYGAPLQIRTTILQLIPENYRSAFKCISKDLPHHIEYDMCPNECVFFKDEYIDLDSCPKCGSNRYKNIDKPISTNIGVDKHSLQLPDDGKRRRNRVKKPVKKNRLPRRVSYYLPIADFIRRLWGIENIAKLLHFWGTQQKTDTIGDIIDGKVWQDVFLFITLHSLGLQMPVPYLILLILA